MTDLDLGALRAQTIRCRDTTFDGNAYDYFVAILGVLDEVERLRMESERPVNAVCRDTWRRDAAGSCPVHGGDACLVSPSGLCDDIERLRTFLRLAEAALEDQ